MRLGDPQFFIRLNKFLYFFWFANHRFLVYDVDEGQDLFSESHILD